MLRLLAKRNIDLGRWRNKVCCRLHAHVAELVPGGITKEIVVAQASELLDGLQPAGAAAVERHRHGARAPRGPASASTSRCASPGVASRPRWRPRAPPSPSSSAWGRSSRRCSSATPATRCASPPDHHYAAYNGTAPIEIASAGRKIHRLSRRGNRQLNHALHMAAVTQIRHAHSPGRAYYDRKVAEGKTPQGSAARLEASHQRRRLPPPRRRRAARSAMTSGPGRTPRERLQDQRGRLTP